MKHTSFLTATLLVCLWLPSKSTFAQEPVTEWTAKAPALNPQSTSEILVRLEAAGCKGYCPIYKLTFHVDGTLNYSGYRNVEELGEKYAKLSADEFSRLQNAVRRANLWEHPRQLPVTVADAPMHTLTVSENGKRHQVKGAGPLPEHIQALDQLMQDIAEAHGFMVKKGVDPNDPANMKGEVIVHFKPEINAGNFCMQFMEFKTRPVRRIAEENIWIVGFYPSEITEAQFIEIIKGMEGVLSITSSKKSPERN